MTNPAMEVLFTVVPREDKYKAKNIIETFVYRGGDQVGAWLYAGLVALGLSLAGHLVRRRSARGGLAGPRPLARAKTGRPGRGLTGTNRESCLRARRGRDLTALPRVGMYTKCVRR